MRTLLILLLLILLIPSMASATLPNNYQQAKFEWAYEDAGWGAQYFQIACGTAPGIYTRLGSTANATVRTASISIAVSKVSNTYYCIVRGVKGSQVTPASPLTTFCVSANWVYEKC